MEAFILESDLTLITTRTPQGQIRPEQKTTSSGAKIVTTMEVIENSTVVTTLVDPIDYTVFNEQLKTEEPRTVAQMKACTDMKDLGQRGMWGISASANTEVVGNSMLARSSKRAYNAQITSTTEFCDLQFVKDKHHKDNLNKMQAEHNDYCKALFGAKFQWVGQPKELDADKHDEYVESAAGTSKKTKNVLLDISSSKKNLKDQLKEKMIADHFSRHTSSLNEFLAYLKFHNSIIHRERKNLHNRCKKRGKEAKTTTKEPKETKGANKVLERSNSNSGLNSPNSP